MTTLYLDRKGLELKLDGRALALYENGFRLRTVPLALLSRVVIRAETTLTSTLLGALTDSDCALVVLSGRQGRRLAIVNGRTHNDAALRLAQYALVQDSDRRLRWACRVVASKVSRQVRFLKEALEVRRDRVKQIGDALRTLQKSLGRVRKGAASLESLRGLEGAAQAAYLRAYTTLFPGSLKFRGRNRRPPRDPVNACLSLAYTLVHFEAVRVCHASGLDPLLGFFHELAFGRESLACDLIEPARPMVDGWVWEMFRSRSLRREHFNLDKGACLLGKTGRARFYERFEGLLGLSGKRMRGYCRLLVRDLRRKAEAPLKIGGEEEA